MSLPVLRASEHVCMRFMKQVSSVHVQSRCEPDGPSLSILVFSHTSVQISLNLWLVLMSYDH